MQLNFFNPSNKSSIESSILDDPAGRSRVSTITSLFDGKVLDAEDNHIWESSGTGTFTFNKNKVNLAVIPGQFAIRRQKYRNPYFSGKPQIVEITFDNFVSEIGITKRIGYFSSSFVSPYDSSIDGFFIENTDGQISLKAYNDGVETINVPIEQWTNYKLISDYNWDNFTVVMFDFLWLGGTELRLFLRHPKWGFLLVHKQPWSGLNSGTFINSPAHEVRSEIRSTTGIDNFNFICCTVESEGGIDIVSHSMAILNTTAVATNIVGTIYALKGIKTRVGYENNVIQLTTASIANTTQSDFGYIIIIKNPTISQPLNYVNEKSIQNGTGSSTHIVTPGTGTIIASAPAGSTGFTDDLKNNILAHIGLDINGNSDEFILAYMPTSGNQSVFGSLLYKEL